MDRFETIILPSPNFPKNLSPPFRPGYQETVVMTNLIVILPLIDLYRRLLRP